MKDSIFTAAMRAFFITCLSVLGVFAALAILVIGLAAIGSKSSVEPSNDFSLNVLADATGKRESFNGQPVILKVNISGVIGLDGLDQTNFRQLLQESRSGDLKDDLVKAVLVYIQTPGGTVTDADGIYRALKNYKEKYKVPVYAYIDGMCASGGMYVAAACDKVLASDVSIIGSVGVISPSALNVSDLMEKIGVKSLTLSAGTGKDDLNPLRPWKPGEETNYKDLIDHFYKEFVHIVVSNRPMVDKEKLIKEYGAKIYPAPKAQEIGYIDESGKSLSDAIAELAHKADLTEGKYRVVQLTKDTWMSEFFKTQLIFKNEMTHKLDLPKVWDANLSNQFLYLHR